MEYDIKAIIEKREKARKEYKKLRDLDSMVFFEIPQTEIKNTNKYRWWLSNLQQKWMTEFNDKNKFHRSSNPWNETGGIYGYFGDEYIPHCKFHRYDGTKETWNADDFRVKRGILIRDHYTWYDVVKVQRISNNLEEFLKQEKIAYTRTDFKLPKGLTPDEPR